MASGRKLRVFGLLLLALLAVAAVLLERHRERRAREAALAEDAARRARLDARMAPLLHRNDAAAPRLRGEVPCVLATVSAGKAFPRVGKCAMPIDPIAAAGPEDVFETDLRYGKFILRQSDLYLDDFFAVALTRTYTSETYQHQNRMAFGNNASHPFDVAPVGSRRPYTYMMLLLADRDFLFFDRISPGTGFEDAVYQHTETATRFYRAVIGWNGSGWTTWLPDGGKMEFPEAYNAKSVAQGAATEIRDGFGHRLDLRRDERGNLREIRTPHAHYIRLAYDEQDRITRAEDDAARWARYQYDADGMLASAELSTGQTRRYAYQGTLMTRIEDEDRRTLLQNWYSGGCVIRQEFGNGEIYAYEYQWPAGLHHAQTVTVIAGDGTRRSVEVASFVPDYQKRPRD
jgi:YD repeat-containing protein